MYGLDTDVYYANALIALYCKLGIDNYCIDNCCLCLFMGLGVKKCGIFGKQKKLRLCQII